MPRALRALESAIITQFEVAAEHDKYFSPILDVVWQAHREWVQDSVCAGVADVAWWISAPLSKFSASHATPCAMRGSLELPVLPLLDAVPFPGIGIPVSVGRETSIAAVNEAVASEGLLIAVYENGESREREVEQSPAVGVIVRIHQHQKVGETAHILITGIQRAEILRTRVASKGFLVATARPLAELPPPEDNDFVAMSEMLRTRVFSLGSLGGISRAVLEQLDSTKTPAGVFADVASFHLDISPDRKLAILAEANVATRVELLLVEVERIRIESEAQERVQARVHELLGERQREVILREQLRAIREELGDADDDEIDLLAARIAELPLPSEARKEAERELRRLRRLPAQTAEHQVIRNYLEWMVDLPWTDDPETPVNLRSATRILNRDHHGLSKVKDRLLEQLAVRALHSQRGMAASLESEPILLFAGPPGVGKTSFARSIAEALDRPCVHVSLGGVRDEADIRGHRRTYVGAMPGRILSGIRSAGSRRPVVVLDEVDKIQASSQGDPAAALLEVLDPSQNHRFVDHYLGVPFDLSGAIFIATANDISAIPAPLLDRMERIEFSSYSEKEKLAIAREHLLPSLLRSHALAADDLRITPQALRTVIREHTYEAGVRDLRRVLARIARRAAKQIATGGSALHVGVSDIESLLGRPIHQPQRARATPSVGFATGMFYSAVGGDILFIETSIAPGPGKLMLTGRLGAVMQESAQAALSVVRARSASLGIDIARWSEVDIHVHVPSGAVPKDGPSAGVAIVVSICSALTGRAVAPDCSMTGEITLAGTVLPVGGIREKILGASRAGIRRILLPRANLADTEELPPEVLREVELLPIDTIEDALFHLLLSDGS